MGGNALKQCHTRRLTASEYTAMVARVVDIISKTAFRESTSGVVQPIKSYKNKIDHGDLDVLVSSDTLTPTWKQDLGVAFSSKQVVSNGDVTSFEFCEFQVDVITTQEALLQSAAHYFDYNDLGNLMGKLTRSIGVKYGHDGLYHRSTFYGSDVTPVLITHDPKAAFDLLLLDYDRYSQGFDDLIDVFEFVSSSHYFNPDVYLLENLNHTARIRDRKRTTYQKFLAWCGGYSGARYKRKNDTSEYLPMLFRRYPDFEARWLNERRMYRDRLEYKEKFNGEVVTRVTGIEPGHELGQFMKSIKSHMTLPVVLSQTQQSIEHMIHQLYTEQQ